MDLENYKKLWKNQPQEGKKLSAVEIYKMAHKRSSSIVKWIFIIGILEFLFWIGINLLTPDSFFDIYRTLWYPDSTVGSCIWVDGVSRTNTTIST